VHTTGAQVKKEQLRLVNFTAKECFNLLSYVPVPIGGTPVLTMIINVN